jgi:5'(3')-deoxyribonucleotidase
MDGVVTDFATAYIKTFNRNVSTDDSFTVTEMCKTEPRFFLTIPVLQRGKELYDRLAKKYNVIFLTTAMDELPYCRADKVTWLKQNICPEPTVIFSASKSDYANSEKDILVDDMSHNLESFYENGGTAIDFTKMTNDEILAKIAEVLNPQAEIIQIKQQIKEMKVNTEPSEKQIKSENYKKGDIIYKNFKIKIENVPGSIRFGFNDEGKKWVSRMKNYYGYIQGIEGADGDAVDCFISENNLSTNKCFVINQMRSDMFDEIKVVFGAKDIEDARKIYLQNYERGWERNIMNIVPTNTKKLRDFFKDGNYKEPFSGEFK